MRSRLLLTLGAWLIVCSSFAVSPVVTSIVRKTPASSTTNLVSLVFTVNFDVSVNNVDISDFTLTTTGGASGSINSVSSSSGASIDVTITSVSSNGGTIRLDLNSSGTGIVDGSSNPISGGFTTGEIYTVDNVTPSVSSIARKTPAAATTNATTLVYTVNFSESVSNVDILDFALTTTGGASGTIDNISSASGASIDVTITPVSSNGGTIRLDLNSSGTGIVDGLSNAIASGYSTGDVYTVDNVAPTVSSIVRKTPATATTNATTLVYTVNFSESVSNVDISDFALTTTGGASGTIDNVSSASGASIDVTITPVSSNGGTIRLDLKSSGTGIVDGLSNAIASGYSTGDVYTVDNVAPTVSSIVRKTPATATTNATTLVYNVNFSESVSNVDISDFVLTTTLGAVGTISGVSSSSGSSIDVTVTAVSSNGGTLRLDLNASGTGIVDGLSNAIATGYTSGEVYTVDNAGATVLSINRKTPATATTNATTLVYTISFSESVSNVDISDFLLTTTLGTTGTISSVSSSSGTSMDVTVNSVSSDGGTVRLDLKSSGTGIVDGEGNSASGFTGGQVYTVDNVAPTVLSIVRKTPSSSITNATSLVYTITFSESVSGVGTGDFNLTKTSTANGTVASVSAATGSAIDVTVNSVSGDGTIRLDLRSSGTGIQDALSNNISGGFTSGDSYTVDHTAPTIGTKVVPVDSWYTVTQALDFTINYDENVYVDVASGTPYLTIDIGTRSNVQVFYFSGSGTSSITFRYVVVGGDYDSNGINLDDNINLNGGTIKDIAGNNADLTFSGGGISGVRVDARRPAILSAVVPSSGWYKKDDYLTIVVTYDKQVQIDFPSNSDNNPYFELSFSGNGGKTAKAYYASGDGTNVLVFKYKVVSGDLDVDGIQISNVVKNFGVIYDKETFNAIIADPNFDISLFVGNQSTVYVDGIAPVVTSKTVPAGTYGIGSVMTITINADGSTYSVEGDAKVNGEVSGFVNTGGGVYKVNYLVQPSNHNLADTLYVKTDIKLKDVAGNITNITSVDVSGGTLSLKTKPTYSISSGTTSRCFGSPTTSVTFSFTGVKPYKLIYRKDGVNQPLVTVPNDTYVVSGVDKGVYDVISLIDDNGTGRSAVINSTEKATVIENALPPFTIKSATVSLNKNAARYFLPDNITITDGGPNTSTFTGECVGTDSYFYPSLAGVIDVPVYKTINYTLTNTSTGCVNTNSFTMEVTGESAYLSGLNPNKAYCISSSEPTHVITATGITGLITTEIFTISNATQGNEWNYLGSQQISIDPKKFSNGWHKITYEYWQGPSKFPVVIDSFNIVRVSPTIDFGVLASKYCSNDPQVLLAAKDYYPVGGTGHFSCDKSGLSSDLNSHVATLKPLEATKNDTIRISYYYQTSVQDGSCQSNIITKKTIVYDITPVDFTIKDNYNVVEKPVTLVSTPTGGKFSGYEIILNDSITLDPSRATSFGNPVNITCKLKDTNGCISTKNSNTKIYKAVAPIPELKEAYCLKDTTFSISCNPAFGTAGEFWSYKGAITQSVKPGNNATYSVLTAGVGLDTVKFTFFNGVTKYQVVKTVYIDEVGNITIIDDLYDPKNEYCISLSSTTLRAQFTHDEGTGIYTYDGVPSALVQAAPRLATFKPNLEVEGKHNVTYTYTSTKHNSQCRAVATKEVTVLALPTITFAPPSYFNINANPIALNATPPGGSFSALSGLYNGNIFKPEAIGNYEISYTVSDANSCSNVEKKTISVVRGDATISGFAANNVVCFTSDPVRIVGSSTNGLPNGSFEGDGITNATPDTAYFDPKVAGPGKHSIKYKFKYNVDGLTELDFSKEITVDRIDNIVISGLTKPTYCMGDPSESPIGYPLNTVNTPGVFSGDGIVAGVFYPDKAKRGVNQITYTYTNNSTGCSLKDSVSVIVNSLPKTKWDVAFKCSGLTSDSVEFLNNTTSDDAINYFIWKIEGSPDTLYTSVPPPPYKFSSIGVKYISLTAKTINDCAASLDSSITVSTLPEVNFKLSSECESPDSIKISSTSVSDITNFKWTIDGNVFEGKTLTWKNYLFNTIGTHNISLAVITKGCEKTVSKIIHLQPFYSFAELPNNIYKQNFDSNTIDWVPKPLTGYVSTWKQGTPNGTIINESTVTNTAWYTEINMENQKKESSAVLSPCFDLSSLEKPMIKLNIWSGSDPGGDGAVLQYTVDGGDTWNNVGLAGRGTNWYSTGNIQGQPGGQFNGWSYDPVMTGWQTARYNLEEVKGATNVRFRVAYAAPGTAYKQFNGFAFDSVWIGERQQMVLSEYFTNSAIPSSAATNSYINTFEVNNTHDVIPIHYHTGIPSGDGLYDDYTAGPSSRSFYYGVTEVPYVYSFGSAKSNLSTSDKKTAFEKFIDEESLKDPKLVFDTIYTHFGEVVVKLKALQNLSGLNLVLYCALVKDNIVEGGTPYYNVLRRFFPNPGGVLLPTGSWGDVVTQKIALSFENTDDYINSKLVVFIQNSSTNEILQVASTPTSLATIDRPIDLGNLVNIYPNPARDFLIVECEHAIDRLTLFDLTGRLVGSYLPAQATYKLPVQDLQNGLYILKGTTKQGEFIRKFVKQ